MMSAYGTPSWIQLLIWSRMDFGRRATLPLPREAQAVGDGEGRISACGVGGEVSGAGVWPSEFMRVKNYSVLVSFNQFYSVLVQRRPTLGKRCGEFFPGSCE